MKESVILVVGGAGFIGSHVNKRLNQAGYQTVVLDNLSRGYQETVTTGAFIKGDLADSALLHHVFSSYSVQAVMHFAAFIDVGESVFHPAKYYLNNVAHALNLLTLMMHYQVKKFIFSSTAAIFGHPLTAMINEEHPCQPINPYGETKWMVEKILRDFETAYALKSCCLRYFNAAGGDPEGKIKNHQIQTPNLIPRILLSLKKDQNNLVINGVDYPTPDGTCIRDYIHIDDLATAHLIALEQLLADAPSSHYNLGNGRGFSIREVIHAAEKVTGRKINFTEGIRRAGDPAVLLADPAKAAAELKWQAQFSLEEMIEHAWKAYL